MIYFDNAATSYDRPACVKEAVAEAIDTFGNPSRGAYGASLQADRCLFETRMLLAELFGADGPDCVSFTMNATQALNTAIFGSGLGPGDHLVVSLQEHNSVLRPAYVLRKKGVAVHFSGLTPDGRFDIDDYRRILEAIREKEPEARIVSALSHGSNVTGYVIPIGKVGELCRSLGSELIVDAAQTAGVIPVSMKKDGIDVLCMSGHKALMGPQGTGAVIVRRGVKLRPLMTGGSGIRTFLETMPEDMPEHLEAGTQNAHSIAGLRAALVFAEGKRGGFREKEMRLRRRLLKSIREINEQYGKSRRTDGREPCGGRQPDSGGPYDRDRQHDGAGPAPFGKLIRIYGSSDETAEDVLPTVSLNIGSLEAGAVADRLWREKEIAVRAGGHCAPLIHRFFGTERRGIVRVSLSHFNTEEQVDVLSAELRKIAEEVAERKDLMES